MFGKKNKQMPPVPVVDFNCQVCGVNCLSREGLERHMSWAHRETGAEQNSGLTTSEKQK